MKINNNGSGNWCGYGRGFGNGDWFGGLYERGDGDKYGCGNGNGSGNGPEGYYGIGRGIKH